MNLVLASRSPQRVTLLRQAGIEFECDPADIDERDVPRGTTPPEIARYLAREKSRATARRHPAAFVLGADTIVCNGGQLLGKPENPHHARQMLRGLSGSTHSVITGICVCHRERNIELIDHAESKVSMRKLTADEIDKYVETGDWHGKAGGYGLQDPDPFVSCVQGSRSNIIGLPIEQAIDLLRRAGFNC